MGAWHSQSYREALGNTMRGGNRQSAWALVIVLQLHATATQTEPAQKVRDLNRNVVVAPESEFCGRPLRAALSSALRAACVLCIHGRCSTCNPKHVNCDCTARTIWYHWDAACHDHIIDPALSLTVECVITGRIS